MTILNNIYRCKNCGLHAIAEEKDFHVCLELKDTRTDDRMRWVFDGITWYPLKLDTIHKTPKLNTEKINSKTPEDEQILI